MTLAGLAGVWKLLLAAAGAFAMFQAWQAKQSAATTDRVDTKADQAAGDAAKAATPEDFAKAAAEMEGAERES